MKAQETLVEENCPKCLKRPIICVCDAVRSVESKTKVLILQHPQEPDKDLGTAQLAHLCLPNSTLKVGLSWPNLAAALGVDAKESRLPNPKDWAVLFLGSAKIGRELKARQKNAGAQKSQTGEFLLLDKTGRPRADSQEVVPSLKGIVVLDGTWAQAKALWWRNPWLLKLNRAVVVPALPSLYRYLRKEPRRECLSTIESVALAISLIENKPELQEPLVASFSDLLKRCQKDIVASKRAGATPS